MLRAWGLQPDQMGIGGGMAEAVSALEQRLDGRAHHFIGDVCLNDLLFFGSHNWVQEFSGFPRLHPGDFFWSVSWERLLEAGADDFGAGDVVALRCGVDLLR